MRIDLEKLPDDSEITQVYDKDWWGGRGEDEQVLALDRPLNVRIKIRRTGKQYVLEGKMAGGLLVKCDRCLEPFHSDLDSEFHVYLQALAVAQPGTAEVELLDEDMEVEFVEGGELDLDAIVQEQIFLALPMKCVCVETCQGLCPVCGMNLNSGACECLKDQGHPAFQKLRNLKIKEPKR